MTYLSAYLERLLIAVGHFQKGVFMLRKIFKVASWNFEAAKDFGDHGDLELRANDCYLSRSLFHFNAAGCHRNPFFHRGVHLNSDFPSQKARKTPLLFERCKESIPPGQSLSITQTQF